MELKFFFGGEKEGFQENETNLMTIKEINPRIEYRTDHPSLMFTLHTMARTPRNMFDAESFNSLYGDPNSELINWDIKTSA